MSDVTMKQIAEIAGVSVATVSYVLNKKKKVSKQTELRVLSVAQQLNYSPNVFAQQLKSKEPSFVFALLNTYSSIFNGETLENIEYYFEQHGLKLLVVTNGIDEVMKNTIFDGGIILNYHITEEEKNFLETFINKPLVLLSSQSKNHNIASVTMDNEAGMKLIINEMMKSKHKNVCFIQGPSSSYNNQIRVETVRRFYESNSERTDFDLRLYQADFLSESAYRLGLNLLKYENYDAFICFNDAMALGLYKAANELNIKVGEDISVTGFDNNFYADYIFPGLTTIDVDKKLWAKKVVEAYFAIKENKSDETQICIPTKLIKRGSINYI